jgi:hypothetical protein
MYNMLATTITTANVHEEDMNAQKLYQDFLKAFADDLSANLTASSLREHLTLI